MTQKLLKVKEFSEISGSEQKVMLKQQSIFSAAPDYSEQ